MDKSQQDLNESLPLPAENMPECWEKDDRMNSLFAQFRNRDVNPQDWDSKYNFWRGMIADWCEHKMRCSFSLSDLNRAFKRNGRTPACLSVVLRELYRNGEIIPVTDFSRESPGTWGSWAVDTLVKRPVFWSFSVLKNRIVEQTVDPETKYVQLRMVKELGELVLSTVEKSEENSLKSLSEVKKNCAEKTNGRSVLDDDIKLALIWLRRNKSAAFQLGTVDDNGEILVKLSKNGVKEVTEVEAGLYNLKKQEELLIKNLEILELEKEAVLKSAKGYLANGMRQVAKSCLGKKRELEKSIERRAAALQNIQILIARVREVHSDSEILSSYKIGAATLRKKLDEDGLTENSVADTMHDLSEVLEELDELQTVIIKPVETYDSELEDELAELLAESPKHEESVTIPECPPTRPGTDRGSDDNEKLPNIAEGFSSLRLKDLPPPPKNTPSIKPLVGSQGE